MKIGDKVRFLNDVGGGVVTGFQSKDIAIVRDENGFDLPTLVRECVVVSTDNYNIARRPTDRKAPTADAAAGVSADVRTLLHPVTEENVAERPVTFRPQPLERSGADRLNIMLAFVPAEAHSISDPDVLFEAYFVNVCNYTLHFVLFCHEGAACTQRAEGDVEANTKLFLEEFRRDALEGGERVTLQAVAYKRGKSFRPKAPLNVGVRIDGPKFYKQQAFGYSDFFEEPALIYDLVRDDRPVRGVYVEANEIRDVLVSPKTKAADRQLRRPARVIPADPSPPIEVDLHATDLLDDKAGLDPKDILQFQLNTFRETMEAHLKEHGRKIVFIHGKGEGVLRTALIKELKTAYKHCRWQDASFREYGFGATLVTIV